MTDLEAVKNAQRLTHIVLAVERILRSVDGVSKEAFFTNEDKQGNVVRCLEIIGEAANHVSTEIQAQNPDIPWTSIIVMRNNLIHGYNEVNYEFVWEAVQRDIIPLKDNAQRILKGLPLPSDLDSCASAIDF